MLVSILHRVTGSALAFGGVLLLVWWLAAIASGPAYYSFFLDMMTKDQGGLNWIPLIILVGLTWSFFQHLFTGLRHLLLDTGAGYELKTNKFWSLMTMVGSVAATIAIWSELLLVRQ